MELRELGRSGLKVSALALGTMNFGSDWHGIGAVDEKTARGLLDLALDSGVNLIDTADIYGYGAAESMLGRILGKRRPSVLLASKVLGRMRPEDPGSGGLSRRHIAQGLEESLKRLRTDYLDLYMPHGLDPKVPIAESLEAFDRAVSAGKVRVLGCSNFPASEWRRWLAWAGERGKPRMEFNQIQLSLAVSVGEREQGGLCAEAGVRLLAWSPLAGGLLSGKYRDPGSRPPGRRKDPERAFPYLSENRFSGTLELLEKVAQIEGCTMAQASLGWVLARPALASAVVGARTCAQLRENLAAKPLSARSFSWLDRAARACSAA